MGRAIIKGLDALVNSQALHKKHMASRYSQKPDPSIKKNVQQARAAANKGRTAHVSLVTASIAVTLFSWALFSNQDAQALEAARAATANPAAITITSPAPDNVARQAMGTPLPLVLGITR